MRCHHLPYPPNVISKTVPYFFGAARAGVALVRSMAGAVRDQLSHVVDNGFPDSTSHFVALATRPGDVGAGHGAGRWWRECAFCVSRGCRDSPAGPQRARMKYYLLACRQPTHHSAQVDRSRVALCSNRAQGKLGNPVSTPFASQQSFGAGWSRCALSNRLGAPFTTGMLCGRGAGDREAGCQHTATILGASQSAAHSLSLTSVQVGLFRANTHSHSGVGLRQAITRWRY